jgi:AbiV family abortive infection protein
MDTDLDLQKYNAFRKLCLINAADAIKSAELMANHEVNHIAYHLLVLSIEEIGKIFVGFNELVKDEQWSRENPNFGFDDHVKKLFWAIWGPTIGQERITKKQWEENQKMASNLHTKRLESLYTGLLDEGPGSAKISNEDLNSLMSIAKARLALAEEEGEADAGRKKNPQLQWLDAANQDSEKRNFIFGEVSMAKMLELGNPQAWIVWLMEYYQKQEQDLKQLLEREIYRQADAESETPIPKWKIKVKIITPSHSIRASVLDVFNKTSHPFIRLAKGGDNHTLFIEFIFPASTTVKTLWEHGWFSSKFFVAALNMASNGLFYWNALLDTEKYYETIRDIENNKLLVMHLDSGLKLNWQERKMLLNTNHLHLARMIFDYLVRTRDPKLIEATGDYLSALALLSKSDIHSRFEHTVFKLFFSSIEIALAASHSGDPYTDIAVALYPQFEKMIKSRTEFERIIALGYQLQQENLVLVPTVSLAEVILIKQYCGFYFMTLAARKLQNDESLILTVVEGEI